MDFWTFWDILFIAKYFPAISKKAFLLPILFVRSTFFVKGFCVNCKVSFSLKQHPLHKVDRTGMLVSQSRCILSVSMHLFRVNKSFMIGFFWYHLKTIIGLFKYLNVKQKMYQIIYFIIGNAFKVGSREQIF